MKLYIPEIGDQFKLITDWTFVLYEEQRNKSLWDLYNCKNSTEVEIKNNREKVIKNEINDIEKKYKQPFGYHWHYTNCKWEPDDITRVTELRNELYDCAAVTVTIPKDSILKLDRIFIRKGMDDWSSLTFYLTHHPDISFKKKPRFWAKLHDCNNIEFDQVST